MKSEVSSLDKSELDLGLGGVSWWGFSPWELLPGEAVLVVGAGDPRHVVRTLAEDQGGQVGSGLICFSLFSQICRRKYIYWSRMSRFTADRLDIVM